jgi:hypothetical protein
LAGRFSQGLSNAGSCGGESEQSAIYVSPAEKFAAGYKGYNYCYFGGDSGIAAIKKAGVSIAAMVAEGCKALILLAKVIFLFHSLKSRAIYRRPPPLGKGKVIEDGSIYRGGFQPVQSVWQAGAGPPVRSSWNE